MTDPQNSNVPPSSGAPQPQYASAPPAYGGAPTEDPGKVLGIVALVAVFFISLLGLILGYVARSQSRKAGFENTPAKIAIILGWIFLILGIIGGILFAVFFAAAASSSLTG